MRPFAQKGMAMALIGVPSWQYSIVFSWGAPGSETRCTSLHYLGPSMWARTQQPPIKAPANLIGDDLQVCGPISS